MARTPSAEPRKRPRQRRSADTVERILAAAARIFDERGYRGTTTNHVAEEAGVSIGSLYQYFPNKDALLVSLAERHVDDVATRFGARLAGLRDERPPLDATVRALLDLTVEVNDTSQAARHPLLRLSADTGAGRAPRPLHRRAGGRGGLAPGANAGAPAAIPSCGHGSWSPRWTQQCTRWCSPIRPAPPERPPRTSSSPSPSVDWHRTLTRPQVPSRPTFQ